MRWFILRHPGGTYYAAATWTHPEWEEFLDWLEDEGAEFMYVGKSRLAFFLSPTSEIMLKMRWNDYCVEEESEEDDFIFHDREDYWFMWWEDECASDEEWDMREKEVTWRRKWHPGAVRHKERRRYGVER